MIRNKTGNSIPEVVVTLIIISLMGITFITCSISYSKGVFNLAKEDKLVHEVISNVSTDNPYNSYTDNISMKIGIKTFNSASLICEYHDSEGKYILYEFKPQGKSQ